MSARRCANSLSRDMIRWSATGIASTWPLQRNGSRSIASRIMTGYRHCGLGCDPAAISSCLLSSQTELGPITTAGSKLKST